MYTCRQVRLYTIARSAFRSGSKDRGYRHRSFGLRSRLRYRGPFHTRSDAQHHRYRRVLRRPYSEETALARRKPRLQARSDGSNPKRKAAREW